VKAKPWYAWAVTEKRWIYSCNPFASSVLERGGWVLSQPWRSIFRQEPQYPLHRRLDGPRRLYEQVRKISSLPEFESQTLQPVRSPHIDYKIPAYNFTNVWVPKRVWIWPLKPRIKCHLLFAGIIRSLPFSPR